MQGRPVTAMACEAMETAAQDWAVASIFLAGILLAIVIVWRTTK